MNRYIFLICFFLQGVFYSQSFLPHQFSELKGMEDSVGKTHLFYRIHYLSKQDEMNFYECNDVYHLNLDSNSDTLKFPEYNQSMGGYFETSVFVSDYEFWHNNPDHYIFGGGGGWCGYFYVRRFDGFGVDPLGSGYVRLAISNQNDSLVYSFLGTSIDGGKTWPMQNFNFHSMNPFNDQVIFFFESYGKLMKSNDGGLTSYVVDSTKFFDRYSDFLYDKDSIHIYAVVKTPEQIWQCRVSNNRGEPGSWTNVFESNCEIMLSYDPCISGHLYLAAANKVFYSNNYGNSFIQKHYALDNIRGIYKKPNSTLLYIAVSNCIYAVDHLGICYTIKSIPLDKEIASYDPIDKGNKWIYSRIEKGSPAEPEMKYLEVKEVIKDTVIDSRKCKKIANYYYNRYYHSSVSYVYEQIDTVMGFTFFKENGTPFHTGEELNFNIIGGKMIASRYGIDSFTTLLSDDPISLFNSQRSNKVFNSINADSTHSYTYSLTYSLGLTSCTEVSGTSTISKTLLGCKIKNKVIGDTSTIVSVNDAALSPSEYNLFQNYPNPFNPETVIKYSVSQPGHVSIAVFDILGNEVKQLVNENKNTGNFEVKFNSAGLSSGVYFYRMKSGNFSSTKKMILLR